MAKMIAHLTLVFILRLLCLPFIPFLMLIICIAAIPDALRWAFYEPIREATFFWKRRKFYPKYWNKLSWFNVVKMAFRKVRTLAE